MLNVCPRRNPFENQAAQFVQFMSREIIYVFGRLSLTYSLAEKTTLVQIP